MKKAIKWILLSVAGLIVVALIVGYIAIDMIARTAIDSVGSSIFGVPVHVNSVHMAVFRSDSSMQGLTIANPKGFQAPYFLQVGDATIQANVPSLLSSDINIPLVHINGLKVDLEQINERLNAKELVANIEKATASTSAEASADDKSSDDSAVSFNIQKLVIDDIELHASGSIVNIAGGHLDAKIPKLELKNLGTKTNGDELADHLVSMMVTVLIRHIADHPIQGLSGAAVGSVATALEKIPLLDHTGVGRQVGDVLKGANKSIGQGIQGIGDGLNNLGNGLGGLLKGGQQGKDGAKKDGGD